MPIPKTEKTQRITRLVSTDLTYDEKKRDYTQQMKEKVEQMNQTYVPHSRTLFYDTFSLIALFCNLTLLSADAY